MLTAFFGLGGLHGVHVTLGGVWLATMLAQVQIKGFRREIVHRLICFNLFWHALDIVWIGIFTIVYLMGGLS
jgi:cytochrome o ubiquinol oxidase subunit 3